MKLTNKKPTIKEVCIAILILYARRHISSWVLHYKRITDVLLKTDLIEFKSKTPEKTVCSTLSSDNDVFYKSHEPGSYELVDYDLFRNDEYINLIINEIENIEKEKGISFI